MSMFGSRPKPGTGYHTNRDKVFRSTENFFNNILFYIQKYRLVYKWYKLKETKKDVYT